MADLKPCPCGKTPTSICLSGWEPRQKWVNAFTGCCGEWMFEFRANYEGEEHKVQLMADAAWNELPRVPDRQDNDKCQ